MNIRKAKLIDQLGFYTFMQREGLFDKLEFDEMIENVGGGAFDAPFY